MHIGVVSDLHVGPYARTRELCVPPPPGEVVVEEGFLERFRELVAKENLHCDYLLLPGDMSHSSAEEELQVASEVVLSIADVLGVDETRIVLCPGNHDKDWRPLNAGNGAASRHGPECYQAIGSEHFIFGRVLQSGTPSLVADPYFSAREYSDLVVVSYNSGWDDGPESRPSHGFIHPRHVERLRQQLAVFAANGRYRVLLVHHHPLLYSDPIPVPDHSAMVNAENLLEMIGDFGFDLVIHGHKHFPRFKNYLTSSNQVMAILCAGSFAAKIDEQWRDSVNNQFHMVSLDGRTADACAFGTIRSWTYRVFRGWDPSDPLSSGIEHKNPFGSSANPDGLAMLLLPVVRDRLEAAGHVTLSELAAVNQDVGHLPARASDRLMRRLAEAVPCELHPSEDPVLLPRS